ncbi:hypothetical protein BGZ70_002720 [Mortierella alpina]|uniref:VASt domain-containing protein n=1 Tax=Mortierella alpina TaxID=64518 RepID=A0A9P6IU67_MORAP|nr:hypothetical protein BGZ70_002720 [Mortierella alpina]
MGGKTNSARTDCRETQRVLEYSPHTIRVLSDVWPNLSGGHLISLLSQICFTWDSPGYTRIKCFTEVEYTRAPSWVSAYEADLLEPIDRFYKELIRRLVESIDKRDATHGWSVTTPATSALPSATEPIAQQKSFLGKANSTNKPPTCNTKSSQPQDPHDSSPALSLLSQQLRKNPPAQPKKSRVSMESARPTTDFVVAPSASHAMTVPTARRNKTAALIIQAMFPAPVSPSGNLSIIPEQAASKDYSRAGDLVAKSDAVAAVLWTRLLKKGTSFLKTATNRTATVPVAGQAITSSSEIASKDHVSKSISTLSIGSTQVRDRSKSEIGDEETAGPRLRSASPSCDPSARISRPSDGQHSEKHTAGAAPSYKILRVVLVFCTVGMVISAMNVWHLYSAVASVVDMLHQSHSSISLNDAAYEQHPLGTQRDMFQKQQHHSHGALAPIQQQKDLLRAEITELMLMLASARRHSQPGHAEHTLIYVYLVFQTGIVQFFQALAKKGLPPVAADLLTRTRRSTLRSSPDSATLNEYGPEVKSLGIVSNCKVIKTIGSGTMDNMLDEYVRPATRKVGNPVGRTMFDTSRRVFADMQDTLPVLAPVANNDDYSAGH